MDVTIILLIVEKINDFVVFSDVIQNKNNFLEETPPSYFLIDFDSLFFHAIFIIYCWHEDDWAFQWWRW